MTDLRTRTISVACALALTAGCLPAPAFAESPNAASASATEQSATQAGALIPIDKQAFETDDSEAGDIDLLETTADLNATVKPHAAFSDEFMYFSDFESGQNYDLTLSSGDNYHAMGCYQFDNRYGLQDFLIACYNYDPSTFSMLAWVKDGNTSLAYEQNADGTFKCDENGYRTYRKLYDKSAGAFTSMGAKLNESWSAAYKADPELFSRLQDGWFYQEYVEFAISLCNDSSHNFNMDNRRDCVKGLVSGICNLFGPGGMQFFVGGTLYGTHYDGAPLNGTMTDREFVTTLCDYIVDHVAEYPNVNSQYVSSYQNRYKEEKATCLAYLENDPEPEPIPTPEPDPEPALQFADVSKDAWYASSVQAASERGIINGWTNESGQQVFNPEGTVTRGQLITMLWRIQGKPQADTSTKTFSDVAYGEYYGDAIRWARATKIVEGYGDNTFKPENPVTREEIAIMVANFANRMDGKNPTSDGVNLSSYPDAKQVDTWAKSSLSWAVDKKIITGWKDSDGKAWLKPTNTATRAEAATILLRYLDAR